MAVCLVLLNSWSFDPWRNCLISLLVLVFVLPFFMFWFWFFQTEFFYVTLAFLEVVLKTRLGLNSWSSATTSYVQGLQVYTSMPITLNTLQWYCVFKPAWQPFPKYAVNTSYIFLRAYNRRGIILCIAMQTRHSLCSHGTYTTGGRHQTESHKCSMITHTVLRRGSEYWESS